METNDLRRLHRFVVVAVDSVLGRVPHFAFFAKWWEATTLAGGTSTAGLTDNVQANPPASQADSGSWLPSDGRRTRQDLSSRAARQGPECPVFR
jgi:hypothetical protein